MSRTGNESTGFAAAATATGEQAQFGALSTTSVLPRNLVDPRLASAKKPDEGRAITQFVAPTDGTRSNKQISNTIY